jgi:diamine N-acetyltransferase
MIIRKAAESDIPAISELAEKIWWPSYRNIISDEQISFMLNDMYSAKSLVEQMSSGIEFLIVERDKLPLAFAGYSLIDPENQVYKLQFDHTGFLLSQSKGRKNP